MERTTQKQHLHDMVLPHASGTEPVGELMGRLFARSRALLAIVALSMIAATCSVSTAYAVPSSAGAATASIAASHGFVISAAAASSSGQCTFVSAPTCQSTDPTVTVSIRYHGTVSDCFFTWNVDWGNGASVQVNQSDPPDGIVPLAKHTYQAPGVYTITISGAATNRCTAMGGSNTFTYVPTQQSPDFVCVTGPGGSCLEPGDGVPVPKTWTPNPPDWLTSPVTGGCVLEFIPGADAFDFFADLGNAVQYDESNGNFFVLLKGKFVDSCSELVYDLLTHKPLGQIASLRQGADQPADVSLADAAAGTPTLFKTVAKSQLKSIEKLPLLRQRFGYAVAELGSEAALTLKYKTAWSSGSQKSMACQLKHGGYRCNWRFRQGGSLFVGYVLISVAGQRYRLETVVQQS